MLGRKKTFAEKLKSLFVKEKNDEFYEDLLDALIEGDVGVKSAVDLVEKLKNKCAASKIREEREILLALKELIVEKLEGVTLEARSEKTNVWLFFGVNGVGKTTSVAKLARYFKEKGENIVVACADTFRAAAIEQLRSHAEKLAVRAVSHNHGGDAAAVVFDAASSISSSGGGLVLADTAGRLHNKENLMRELIKIDRIARERASEGCYKKLLVLDATTGQNAFRQAEVFKEAVGIDAVILTKYDSSAKGGVLINISSALNLPVAFICTGEKYEDLQTFDAEEYANEFLGL